MIYRNITPLILQRADDNKAIILGGPRQVGKTTLLQTLFKDTNPPPLWLNGDEVDTREQLSNTTSTRLRNLIGHHKIIVIDEAQRIENIGLTIKLIVDNLEGVKVFASGSSAFELANRINEPLTGRKWEFHLYPLSWQELQSHYGAIDERRLLEDRLIFGSYPEIVTHPGDRKARLQQLADSYLYKDILTWEQIKKPDRLERLLQAIALQLGQQVSYNELARLTGLDNSTVERYILLLEKSFIIYRLRTFSRNLRNELKKSRKIYFYDNGIRNAIINNFNPLILRNDVGALWENYLITERMKSRSHANIKANHYFWRTHAQQKIDYLEEYDGQLRAWEFKWKSSGRAKIPKTFINNYPQAISDIITPDNYESFLNNMDNNE